MQSRHNLLFLYFGPTEMPSRLQKSPPDHCGYVHKAVCDITHTHTHTHTHIHKISLHRRSQGTTPTQHVYCEQASFASRDSTCGLSHTYTHTCTIIVMNNEEALAYCMYAMNVWGRWWWEVACACICDSVLFFLNPGGGYLHCEARGPVLHLSLLSADTAQWLCPRFGHLFQHRVHQMPQEDWLFHWWECTQTHFYITNTHNWREKK